MTIWLIINLKRISRHSSSILLRIRWGSLILWWIMSIDRSRSRGSSGMIRLDHRVLSISTYRREVECLSISLKSIHQPLKYQFSKICRTQLEAYNSCSNLCLPRWLLRELHPKKSKVTGMKTVNISNWKRCLEQTAMTRST